MKNTSEHFIVLAQETKKASDVLARASLEQIHSILKSIASGLRAQKSSILDANQMDMKAGEEKDLGPALLDRLMLDEGRIESMANGVEAIIDLPDPCGKTLWKTKRPNGLKIQRISVPIGVLGMIYESRPNVTIDASALSLKSRNAIILRGGSESLNSALALHRVVQDALQSHDLPEACVSMIDSPDRALVGEMLKADQYIDVIIPRGGRRLIERIRSEARMPVFSHLDGLCHTFIHKSADPDIAVDVTYNAKMRRTGICGATETLLLDHALAPDVAKRVLGKLLDNGVTIYGDKMAQALDARIEPAEPSAWGTEYLDSVLNCAVVHGVDEAINHINSYGSHHTDAILAEDAEAVQRFLDGVNSGIVMHNASTQFADGGEFGMGAEIGISTGKMHARGPVGLEQLCTYKYLVHGTGQTRP